MRALISALLTVVMLSAPADAAPREQARKLRPGELGSREAVLAWINAYRVRRDFANVPEAVKALSQLNAFRDPESAGVFVGFLAGLIASRPEQADELVAKLIALLAPEDHWAIVQAIAYSGLADWQALMRRHAEHMPARRAMIEKYLAGKLPTLEQAAFERAPSVFDNMREQIVTVFGGRAREKPVLLEPSPVFLDTLWGYYYATGAYSPGISRIIAMLPWSKERDHVDKLTVGSMAKFTLASNAMRDLRLLKMLKRVAPHHPKETAEILAEVIAAAETVDIARVRKEALVAIEEIKRKGPASRRNLAWWGQMGEGAIGLGCVAAAALGQVAFGLPCVAGGALTSAGLRYLSNQP